MSSIICYCSPREYCPDKTNECSSTTGCFYSVNTLNFHNYGCISDSQHYTLHCTPNPNTYIQCCNSPLHYCNKGFYSANHTNSPTLIDSSPLIYVILLSLVLFFTFVIIASICLFISVRCFGSNFLRNFFSFSISHNNNNINGSCNHNNNNNNADNIHLNTSHRSDCQVLFSEPSCSQGGGAFAGDDSFAEDSSSFLHQAHPIMANQYATGRLNSHPLGPELTCTSGSGSGMPFLVQRTVARQINLHSCIGKGRYGEVWRAEYSGEDVAVKIFSSREEASWARETEIYNTILLRHNNILGYFASDMISKNGCTELWIVTHYHPLGSLYEYLQLAPITKEVALKFACSAATGLCHLHMTIFGLQGKPAIVHRDIKSKNILVKSNGECCIADLGLAIVQPMGASETATYASSTHYAMDMGVMNASNGWCKPTSKPLLESNTAAQPRVGTRRYMSPEILNLYVSHDDHMMALHCSNGNDTDSAKITTLAGAVVPITTTTTDDPPPNTGWDGLSFDVYKSADVYAFGLVLWEILNRTDLLIGEYQLPYWDKVNLDPTYEEMKSVVCTRGERPHIWPRWNDVPWMNDCVAIMRDCWHAEPQDRINVLRLKKSLLTACKVHIQSAPTNAHSA